MKNGIGFVVNPISANGKTGKVWPELKQELYRRFGNSIKQFITEYPGHAIELTRQLIHEDVKYVIAVGGDGTLNEVVNGFFHEEKLINPSVSLGLICMGTGADFIRTLGWPKKIPQALDRLELRQTRKIDIGKAEFLNLDGESAVRYFINIADFGFGGEVVRRVKQLHKVLWWKNFIFIGYFVHSYHL